MDNTSWHAGILRQSPPPRGKPAANSGIPYQLNICKFMATHATTFGRESRALTNTWSWPWTPVRSGPHSPPTL